VVFAFDGDKAGRQAAWKALSITLPVLGGNRAARFFFLPDGEDPDSLVRNIGTEAFNAQLLQALSPGECLAQGLVGQSGLSWQVADDARRLLSQSVELVKSCQDVGVQYGLVQALSKAAAMQEWQVEKVLGIRTGMAVHRRPERSEYKPTWKNGKRVVVDEVFDPAKSLSTRLLGLLVDFPALSQVWPREDEALLKQLPQAGLSTLLARLADATPNQVAHTADWMQPDEALQEWNDGWRQLVCQALQFVRDQCLKNGDVAPMTDKAVNDVRQWSERLRAECFKRGS